MPDWSSASAGSTWAVALGDIDGDGDHDLVVGDGSQGALFLNQAGVFELTPSWSSMPMRAISVALGDLDSDGDLDLALGNASQSDLVYLNESGTFAATPAWSSDPMDATSAVALGDVDGDGHLDLVAANFFQANTAYLNLGATLDPMGSWFSSREIASAVGLGDVDGDGDLDLVATGRDAENRLHLNEEGRFSADRAWSSPSSQGHAVGIADLDGNGYLDLILGNEGPNAIYYNFVGIPSHAPGWLTQESTDTRAVAVGDVDRDGDLDLVFGNIGANTLYVNDEGTMSAAPAWSSGELNSTYAVALGDVNGDGNLDLVCGNELAANTLYLNLGTTFSTTPTSSFSPTPDSQTHGVALGDVDGDGDLDLVCGNLVGHNRLYLNESGVLSSDPAWSAGGTSNTRAVSFGDVDGDGDLDLVCGNQESNTVYSNDDGMLSRGPVWTGLPLETNDVALGDVDLDGDLDALCGNETVSALYLGLESPAYRGDVSIPRNHLPNSPAHLLSVDVTEAGRNRRSIELFAHDVESDPVWLVPEFQYTGVPVWTALGTVGGPFLLGPWDSSPSGVSHEFEFDFSRLPFDDRDAVLRLRTVSNPARAGLIRQVPSYRVELGPITPIRPEISVFPDSIAFQTVTVGDTVSVKLLLRNTGNEELRDIDVLPPAGPFRLAAPPPSTLAPLESAAIVAILEPVNEQAVEGSMRIESDDPLSPSLAVLVKTDIRGLEFTSELIPTGPVELGQNVTVFVKPEDQVRIERGIVVFFGPDGVEHSSLLTEFGEDDWSGVIPGEHVRETGLQYYVRVWNDPVSSTGPLREIVFQPPVSFSSEPQATSGDRFVENIDVRILVEPTQGMILDKGTLHYRLAGRSRYDSVSVIPDSTSGREFGTIPAEAVQARGLEYYVRVRTVSGVELSDPQTDAEAKPHILSITTLGLPEPTTWPGGVYRMVSIPLDFGPTFSSSLESLLSDQAAFLSYDPTRWRAFRYVDGENVELTEEPFREHHVVRPGRAFWLVTRDEHRVDSAPREGASVSTDSSYVIPLATGWNQIGNPFAFPVAWSDVDPPASIGDPMEFRGGSYLPDAAQELAPFSGYFVWNSSESPQEIRVPPIEAAALPSNQELDEDTPALQWRLRILATAPGAGPSEVLVGAHPEASAAFDALDGGQPPRPPGRSVHLAVENRGWSDRPGLYRRDLRDTKAMGHAWNLELVSWEPGAAVALSSVWDPAPPHDVVVRLIDREQSVSVDGQERTGLVASYELVSFGPEKPYRLTLLVGDAAYVERQSAQLVELPRALSLGRSAPNPLRSATRIRFGLPGPTVVNLAIYNLRGRRVTRLVDHESLREGFHTAIWDGLDDSGKRVSSGVYFYRLETETAVRSRKLIVIR